MMAQATVSYKYVLVHGPGQCLFDFLPSDQIFVRTVWKHNQEIRRVKPHDLGELQAVVSDFVESLDKDVARRAVRDVRSRAEMCIKWAAAFRVQI